MTVNIEALKQGIRVLKAVDAAKQSFDMDTWGTLRPPVSEDEACGTTCCAVGYMALDPGSRRRA